MDVHALQLAARFALPPNSLGYCGRGSAPEKFMQCIAHEICDGVEEEITKFIVLHPYLRTIAAATNQPIFSQEVIESYCLGNELLTKIEPKHYDLLLDSFATQGVPDWLVKELRATPPKKFIPTHLFQVLHVGVGRASGSVPFNLETINNCMVRWGIVQKIETDKAIVELNSLEKNDDRYKLSTQIGSFAFSAELTANLKIGDAVAVHWQQIIKILDTTEVKKLEYWTKETIDNR